MKNRCTNLARGFSPCAVQDPARICADAQRARAKSPCQVCAAKPLVLGCLLLLMIQQPLRAASTTAPTVGIEGRIQIHLPGTELIAKPVNEKAPLILRVASATVGPNGGFYDLRYVGLVPGDHDLKDYLVRADGSPLGDLPPIPVNVAPLLPENHDGKLIAAPMAGLPWFGGYRAVLIAIVAIWALLLIPLMLAGRRRRGALPPTEEKQALTFADRLRPFIAKASMDSLSAQEKSVLERLLLTYWQRRLGLTETPPSEAIIALRADPKAGELLRTLENWLHRPIVGLDQEVDVNALLKPYQDAPEPAAEVHA